VSISKGVALFKPLWGFYGTVEVNETQ